MIISGPTIGENFASTRTCLIITPATRAQCLRHEKTNRGVNSRSLKIKKTSFASGAAVIVDTRYSQAFGGLYLFVGFGYSDRSSPCSFHSKILTRTGDSLS